MVKSASTVSLVIEQYLRMLHHCGLPKSDIDLIHCGGRTMNELITTGPVRLTQFTGSSGVAESLAELTRGKGTPQ